MPRANGAVIELVRKRRLTLSIVIFVIGVLIAVLAFSLRSKTYAPSDLRTNVVLNSEKFVVDVVNTPASRQLGLSRRKSLQQNEGMLFVYDKPVKNCIWMKDMKFDIDIVWYDQNKKLVHQKQQASPASYPESFCPPGLAMYVVELPAGTVSELNLQLGDALSFSENF